MDKSSQIKEPSLFLSLCGVIWICIWMLPFLDVLLKMVVLLLVSLGIVGIFIVLYRLLYRLLRRIINPKPALYISALILLLGTISMYRIYPEPANNYIKIAQAIIKEATGPGKGKGKSYKPEVKFDAKPDYRVFENKKLEKAYNEKNIDALEWKTYKGDLEKKERNKEFLTEAEKNDLKYMRGAEATAHDIANIHAETKHRSAVIDAFKAVNNGTATPEQVNTALEGLLKNPYAMPTGGIKPTEAGRQFVDILRSKNIAVAIDNNGNFRVRRNEQGGLLQGTGEDIIRARNASGKSVDGWKSYESSAGAAPATKEAPSDVKAPTAPKDELGKELSNQSPLPQAENVNPSIDANTKEELQSEFLSHTGKTEKPANTQQSPVERLQEEFANEIAEIKNSPVEGLKTKLQSLDSRINARKAKLGLTDTDLGPLMTKLEDTAFEHGFVRNNYGEWTNNPRIFNRVLSERQARLQEEQAARSQASEPVSAKDPTPETAALPSVKPTGPEAPPPEAKPWYEDINSLSPEGKYAAIELRHKPYKFTPGHDNRVVRFLISRAETPQALNDIEPLIRNHFIGGDTEASLFHLARKRADYLKNGEKSIYGENFWNGIANSSVRKSGQDAINGAYIREGDPESKFAILAKEYCEKYGIKDVDLQQPKSTQSTTKSLDDYIDAADRDILTRDDIERAPFDYRDALKQRMEENEYIRYMETNPEESKRYIQEYRESGDFADLPERVQRVANEKFPESTQAENKDITGEELEKVLTTQSPLSNAEDVNSNINASAREGLQNEFLSHAGKSDQEMRPAANPETVAEPVAPKGPASEVVAPTAEPELAGKMPGGDVEKGEPIAASDESKTDLERIGDSLWPKHENIAEREPSLGANRVEPIDAAAPEVVAPTEEPAFENKVLGEVAENGKPVAVAKPNKFINWLNDSAKVVKKRVSDFSEKWKKRREAEQQDWDAAIKAAPDPQLLDAAKIKLKTQAENIINIKQQLKHLEPGTEEFQKKFQELKGIQVVLADNIRTFRDQFNRGVSDNIVDLTVTPEVNFDSIDPSKFGQSISSNHTITLTTPMSADTAAALEANNPSVKIIKIDPVNDTVTLEFNKAKAVVTNPMSSKTELQNRLNNKTPNPFTRSDSPIPSGDINQPLIEKQLDLIRALERKYAAQLMTGQSTAGTEAALTDARTTLQKLEGVTSKSLEDMTKQLASYIPGNLKLNKDTGRFEYIPGYDQAKDLLDRLPTPEARKLLEDRGYKIITPEEGYHSGYTTYVSTPDGVMPVKVPGRRPDNVVIVPKDYVSSDGYVIPGNNFNDIVYRPGKGTISLKTKDPVTDAVRQDNASNNTPGISRNGNTFTINRQNELFKPLSSSGLGHNSFGTNVSRAYHAGGKINPATGSPGMGIAPKLLLGTAGTVGTTWAGKELSENYISPWAESATTGWYNLWQDNPRKPILQINGNEIVNPTGLGSTTTLNADGTATRKGKDEDGNTTVDTYQKSNGAPVESTVYDKEDKPVKTEMFDSGGELKERVTRGPDSSETVEKRGPDGKITRTVVPPPKDPTLGDWMTKNVVPEYFSNKENFGSYGHSLFGALAGGALGAGIGGLNYILTDENELSEEEKKKRSLARAMLSSAGIGAGIGGLIGGASDYTRA